MDSTAINPTGKIECQSEPAGQRLFKTVEHLEIAIMVVRGVGHNVAPHHSGLKGINASVQITREQSRRKVTQGWKSQPMWQPSLSGPYPGNHWSVVHTVQCVGVAGEQSAQLWSDANQVGDVNLLLAARWQASLRGR